MYTRGRVYVIKKKEEEEDGFLRASLSLSRTRKKTIYSMATSSQTNDSDMGSFLSKKTIYSTIVDGQHNHVSIVHSDGSINVSTILFDIHQQIYRWNRRNRFIENFLISLFIVQLIELILFMIISLLIYRLYRRFV